MTVSKEGSGEAAVPPGVSATVSERAPPATAPPATSFQSSRQWVDRWREANGLDRMAWERRARFSSAESTNPQTTSSSTSPARVKGLHLEGFAWTLWTTRNKMAIESSFPKAPTDVIYNAISLLQKWKDLLKEEDTKKVDQFLKTSLEWLHTLKTNAAVSDVYEI